MEGRTEARPAQAVNPLAWRVAGLEHRAKRVSVLRSA
jgi:hypothetical protein